MRTASTARPGRKTNPSKLTTDMRRTLIVTNDFPPRQGGIQSFVHELALRLDPGQLTVYAPKWDGDAAFDAAQPFEVVRHPTSLMIGGPSVRRRAAELARSRKAEVVIFGASAPLGLITPVLRKSGVKRAIAITHGHEAGWDAPAGAREQPRPRGWPGSPPAWPRASSAPAPPPAR